MVLVKDTERIGFAQGQFPLQEIVIQGDVYLLTSPMTRGLCRLEIDGRFIREIEVRPGMMRVVAPGERTHMTSESLQTSVVSVPGTIYRNTIESQDGRRPLHFSSYPPPVVRPSAQVKQLFTALSMSKTIDANQRPLFVDGLTHALMACLLDNQTRENNSEGQLHPIHLSHSEMKRSTDFAHSMLDESMDLNTWASTLGLSASSFTRRFKATTGKAPYTWFVDLRIARAKHLLENPRLSLAQIASEVGFSSQSHFTEAFRQRTGIAPGRWRSEVS